MRPIVVIVVVMLSMVTTSQLVLRSYAQAKTRTLYFSAASFYTDGVQCKRPETQAINGDILWMVNCADNRGSVMLGEYPKMEDDYAGDTVAFVVRLINTGHIPTGAFSIDFSAKCAPLDDDKTPWGISVKETVNLAPYERLAFVEGESMPVVPNGNCGKGRPLSWRAQVDEALTTTQTDDTYILGVHVQYEGKVPKKK